MKAALVLFILALGAVCLNASPVYDENHNIEEGGGNGNRGELVNGGDGGNGALSRQKRSRRRHPVSSSSSSSSEERAPRHRHRGGRTSSGSSGSSGGNGSPSRSGRQFFAPGVVHPYGALGPVPYAHPAPVAYVG